MQSGVTDGMAFLKGHEPDLSPLFQIDDKNQIMGCAVSKVKVWLKVFYFYLDSDKLMNAVSPFSVRHLKTS